MLQLCLDGVGLLEALILRGVRVVLLDVYFAWTMLQLGLLPCFQNLLLQHGNSIFDHLIVLLVVSIDLDTFEHRIHLFVLLFVLDKKRVRLLF